MSQLHCLCQDPWACNCPARGHAHPYFSNPQRSSSTPTPTLPQWSDQYAFASQQPSSASTPSPHEHVQSFGFHNTFQASYLSSHQIPQVPEFGVPLGDATIRVLNEPRHEPTARKRKGAGQAIQPQKRHKNTLTAPTTSSADSTSSITPPPVPGVGPSTGASAPTLHPAFTHGQGSASRFGSLTDSRGSGTSGASDVWYFVRGLHTNVRPETLPEKETLSEKRPDKKEFAHVGCRLCKAEDWTTWKNVDGQATTIRKHLKSKHGKYWREMVILKQLKDWHKFGKANEDPTCGEKEPFTLHGFYYWLLKWIAVDDQSLGVVDCPELRELLLYIGAELEEHDIPHRTKLSELLTAQFKTEYSNMVKDIENSLGRVSFTSDIWSRQNLESYMAITAHYCAKSASGTLVVKSQLIAFRHIQGSHTGINIGRVFVQVVKEIGCLHKIGMITLDNASNNSTLMVEVSDELREQGIPFDEDGNRIRCFPHVVNIAVKAGLKHLTNIPIYDPDIDPDDPEVSIPQALKDDIAYWQALKDDVVASARSLVAACRASGQRREDFENIIEKGNERGGWGDPPELLRVVGLLKDVDTRWSSTFIMIDRVLELYLAIEEFLNLPKYIDISHHAIDKVGLQALTDIRQFLYVPHVVQELVSAEKTPTLSIVLPMYEKLIVMLNNLKNELPKIAHAISASVEKLQEYLALSRQTKLYTLAMVLNPTIKFKWLKDHWPSADYEAARCLVRDCMLEYQKQLCTRQVSSTSSTPSPPTTVSRRIVKMPSASHAALAQASGFARLSSLARSLSTPAAVSSPATPTSEMSEEDQEAARQRIEAADLKVVEDEIRKFEGDGVIDDDHPEIHDFDLLRYWQSKQTVYPLLWRIGLDILPVQASAVPCERVFSSSKETDTLRRSSLSPVVMEILQILKFIFRKDRLNFTEDLICTEKELSVIDVSPSVVEGLLAAGKINELMDLLDSSWEGWGQAHD